MTVSKASPPLTDLAYDHQGSASAEPQRLRGSIDSKMSSNENFHPASGDLPVYFILPEKFMPDRIPQSVNEGWRGFGLGIHAWTLQTYLRLREIGFNCELVTEMPPSGLVVAHGHTLRAFGRNHPRTAEVFLICVKGDGDWVSDADLHVVQNLDEERKRYDSHYLPHWPQPGLLPRDSTRGNRFDVVSFFGHERNLAPEIVSPEWEQSLCGMGLEWQPILSTNHWLDPAGIDARVTDYRGVDVVVAVRSFEKREMRRTRSYCQKPATKLYNAWLAGVPAVLGIESAFRAERRSDLDYIEVASVEEATEALRRLKADPALRTAMVSNGRQRAAEFKPESIVQAWRSFLTQTALTKFQRKLQAPRLRRAMARVRRRSAIFIDRQDLKVRRKLTSLI